MITYQDFEAANNKLAFVWQAISLHTQDTMYKEAIRADKYDHQKNETIYNYIQTIFSLTGAPIEDFTASNNKIASNFFHRLNTQRCTYSLGNGVTFSNDDTKDRLGDKFDTDLKKLAYKSLIHGVSFGFWNLDRLYVFPLTEFVPLWDEETGELRAGIRFWKIDKSKPTMVVFYEEDGYTKYKSNKEKNGIEEVQPKRAYKTVYSKSDGGGEEVIGEQNYSSLPIVPLWGSDLKQSTLVGMQKSIDSFDLIRSGFANDLTDCAQIYWILENCGGMSDADLAKFRDRLKINHIAQIDGDATKVTPFTQEPPYGARKEYLDMIRAGIYEDFGGLDVHTVAAGATNDHIDAAYQPLDENADDFEYQIIEFVQQVLSLMGIEDTPIFKRNRISNQSEQTQMVLSAADYLDDETVLNKLPFITPDEVDTILENKEEEDMNTFEMDDTGMEAARNEMETGMMDELGTDVIQMLEDLLSEVE